MGSWGWERGVVVAAALATLMGVIVMPASARDGSPEWAELYQSVTVDLEADQHLVVTCTGMGSGYLASIAGRWSGEDWGSASLTTFGAGRGPVATVASGEHRAELDPQITAWDVNFTIEWGGGSHPAHGTVAWALFHADGKCHAYVDDVSISVTDLDNSRAIAAYAEDFSSGLGVEAVGLARVAGDLALTVDTVDPTYYSLSRFPSAAGAMQYRVADAEGDDGPQWAVDAEPGRRTFYVNGADVVPSWPLLVLLQLPS